MQICGVPINQEDLAQIAEVAAITMLVPNYTCGPYCGVQIVYPIPS